MLNDENEQQIFKYLHQNHYEQILELTQEYTDSPHHAKIPISPVETTMNASDEPFTYHPGSMNLFEDQPRIGISKKMIHLIPTGKRNQGVQPTSDSKESLQIKVPSQQQIKREQEIKKF